MAGNNMTLEDWLDDLCVRFIIHLPKEDLSSVARICFQVEEAQWFYEDFIRPLDPTLPSMNLRSFCLRIFQHCPLLASFSVENHMRAFEEFLQYKTRVPVRGAILLNEAMDSTVLVKGWKKAANWSFPRGKINKDEDDLDCAIREVYEETGFDIREAGLVPKDDDVKYIQISMREQQIRLYVFRNVPMDTVFEPKTRKEISKVDWYKLSELPAFRKKGNAQDGNVAASSNANKFYMVAPFLVPLKKWVVQQKKKDAARVAASYSQLAVQPPAEEPLTEDDIGAQTEPVPGPANGGPAIETLEGATRELQRLLKVQPPTQGLQVTPPTGPSADKGEALMALLQRGAGAPSQPGPQHAHLPNAQVPHAPFDLTYTNAPEPHAPHYHHPTQRLPAPNYQHPPNFPIPHGLANNASAGYLQQGLPSAQMAPQNYGRNPFGYPGQQHRADPVLVHPQPLPPQVQQSLLTRGILPTPGLPDAAGQGAPQPQQGGQIPFAARRNDVYAPQHQTGKPSQLTGHAMSLLNAFKAAPHDSESKPRGNISHDNTPLQTGNQAQQQPASWTNVQVTQAANPAAQYLPQYIASTTQMKPPSGTMHPSETYSGPKPAQPTPAADSHRSALLDIFKRPGRGSPLSNEIKMDHGQGQGSAGFAKRGEPESPSFRAPAAAETTGPASRANGGPVKANAGPNLPYRPMQILSRPKQADAANAEDYASTQAQMQRLQQRISPHGPARQDVRIADVQGLPSPRDRVLSQPQLGQEAKQSPQYAAAQAASLPYAQQQQQSPSSTHAAPSSHHPHPHHHPQQQQQHQQHQRKDSNPEQRQRLLSLFSMQQQPSPAASDGKGKGKEPTSALFDNHHHHHHQQPQHQQQHQQQHQSAGTTPPRSRVASLASAAGGTEPPPAPPPAGGAGSGGATTATDSRRGSATPISPADRSFLFSYLESMTKPGR